MTETTGAVRIYEQSESAVASLEPQVLNMDVNIEPEDVRAENTVTLVWEISDP